MTQAMPSRAATIYDVARAAGVSHMTVSRYIKGERISDPNRERVEAAIAQLSFRPSRMARALATKRSTRIGALAYETTQSGPIGNLTGASAAAREAGYVLDIVTLDPRDPQSTRDAIDLVNHNDVAGILAFAPNDSVREVLERTEFMAPVDWETENETAEFRQDDVGFRVGRAVAEHFLALGHRRLAHLSGPLDWPAARLRAAGFAETVRAAEADIVGEFEGDWSPESGYRGALKLIREGRRPTAIFAANDLMAIGAIAALRENGLEVPTAISIAGADDSIEAPYVTPSLTSVPIHFEERGRHAFERLMVRIQGGTPSSSAPTPASISVEATVIARASSGPAPAPRR